MNSVTLHVRETGFESSPRVIILISKARIQNINIHIRKQIDQLVFIHYIIEEYRVENNDTLFKNKIDLIQFVTVL